MVAENGSKAAATMVAAMVVLFVYRPTKTHTHTPHDLQQHPHSHIHVKHEYQHNINHALGGGWQSEVPIEFQLHGSKRFQVALATERA